MNKFTLTGAAILVVALGAYAVTRSSEQTAPAQETMAPAEGAAMVAVTLPDTLSPEGTMGKRAFDAVCADCHGDNAAGKMGIAPPLIHKIYEPSHHGDMAFQMAAANGVRAHHWKLGDMPPQPGVTRADVTSIIAYIREVQRANGIN
ncbi:MULTISPECIES: c-type cytochrome [Alphaproteobacteria]|jgi:mono/diheme cytochrome c family protein|uniref:Cytochrome c family protein n=1 Tax=Salipiger bermudensis (strain DSM 26914 / JCM 13377 / KCTC 12554 / HTCC2601) TaxID=314265 RepID=Q0FJF6_SALBH|nr:cytochrome c [Salipiger bermudensis]EAU44320.1 cytochrome c family protein [Salipiger bermudensis HTCC2601]MAE88258.1 cytochrome C [Pelagibaca sp.]MBN9678613.1 cytochrome c [Salipiger bermudensis]MCA1288562.1 cytochrome c [Salipiger bermudensis]